MRVNTVLAFGLFAVALIAAVMVACSDSGPECKPGTLALQVELSGTANFADTINVQSFEPNASIDESFVQRSRDSAHWVEIHLTVKVRRSLVKETQSLACARSESCISCDPLLELPSQCLVLCQQLARELLKKWEHGSCHARHWLRLPSPKIVSVSLAGVCGWAAVGPVCTPSKRTTRSS